MNDKIFILMACECDLQYRRKIIDVTDFIVPHKISAAKKIKLSTISERREKKIRGNRKWICAHFTLSHSVCVCVCIFN